MFDLSISLKSEDLKKAKIQEKLVEWGGKLFSQEPPLYAYNNSLIFDEYPNNNYFKKYYGKLMGNDFDIDKYRTFRLLGDHLSTIEKQINIDISELSNNEIYKFIINIWELNEFAIFLIRDEEEIDVSYKINTKEEMIEILCNCLRWDSPKGVLITKY